MTARILYEHIHVSENLNSAIFDNLRSLDHRLSKSRYGGSRIFVKIRPLSYRPTGFLNVVEVELGVMIPKRLNFVVKRHGTDALFAARETISAAEKIIRRWTEKQEGGRKAFRHGQSPSTDEDGTNESIIGTSQKSQQKKR